MKTRIKGLDGLRGIAVILVFIEHFVRGGHGLGPLGVKLFFVLSGFLIVGILHKQRQSIEDFKSSAFHELKIFWKRRARRIFPIYFITLFILALNLYIESKSPNTEGLLWYFFFGANFYIQNVSLAWGAFTHLWSISVEQHFYMLSSPILLFLSTKYHKKVLILISSIAFITLIANLLNHTKPISIEVSSIINFAFMAAGGLIALNKQEINKDKLMITSITMLLLYLIVYHNKTFNINILSIASYSLLLIGCTSLIGYITLAQESKSVSFLEYGPIKKLGEISYGFYVYHYFSPRVPEWVESYYLNRLWFLIQFVITVIVAWLSWNLIEKRLLRS